MAHLRTSCHLLYNLIVKKSLAVQVAKTQMTPLSSTKATFVLARLRTIHLAILYATEYASWESHSRLHPNSQREAPVALHLYSLNS